VGGLITAAPKLKEITAVITWMGGWVGEIYVGGYMPHAPSFEPYTVPCASYCTVHMEPCAGPGSGPDEVFSFTCRPILAPLTVPCAANVHTVP